MLYIENLSYGYSFLKGEDQSCKSYIKQMETQAQLAMNGSYQFSWVQFNVLMQIIDSRIGGVGLGGVS